MLLTNDILTDPFVAPASGHTRALLVRSWRRIAAGRGDCPSIARDFAAACPASAAEVLATFRVFLTALAYASPGILKFGHPGSPGLTVDEGRVLSLLAVAQGSRPWLLDGHLACLARRDARLTLAIGAAALAEALSANGLMLGQGGAAGGVTVH